MSRSLPSLNALRAFEAAARLGSVSQAATELHVTQIAYLTGFSDASHFILWFRKEFGETPCSFRKRRHDVEKLINSGH